MIRRRRLLLDLEWEVVETRQRMQVRRLEGSFRTWSVEARRRWREARGGKHQERTLETRSLC